jgi:phosphoribosyl-dephospho-CoA transferase
MEAIRRQQLAFLKTGAWAVLQERSWDDGARRCLALWSERGLPLVIARQPNPLDSRSVALGLPMPLSFGRRRLALTVDVDDLDSLRQFPPLADVCRWLESSAQRLLSGLEVELRAHAGEPRVYGSYGWKTMTGLDFVRPDSDLDLLLPVTGAAAADEVCRALQSAPRGPLRLDGELVFPSGGAVAWREWLSWRGRPDGIGILVKHTHGVSIERSSEWLATAAGDGAPDTVFGVGSE